MFSDQLLVDAAQRKQCEEWLWVKRRPRVQGPYPTLQLK